MRERDGGRGKKGREQRGRAGGRAEEPFRGKRRQAVGAREAGFLERFAELRAGGEAGRGTGVTSAGQYLQGEVLLSAHGHRDERSSLRGLRCD